MTVNASRNAERKAAVKLKSIESSILDFTFRRLENMPLFSERIAAGNIYNESIVNYLPALTKQHDYSLANLYVYAAQPNVSFQSDNLTKAGEIGIQTDLYYFIEQETLLGGKYGTSIAINASLWNNLDGTFDFSNQNYDTDLFSFGEKYFSETSLEIRKKCSEKLEGLLVQRENLSKAIDQLLENISKGSFLNATTIIKSG